MRTLHHAPTSCPPHASQAFSQQLEAQLSIGREQAAEDVDDCLANAQQAGQPADGSSLNDTGCAAAAGDTPRFTANIIPFWWEV